MKFKVIREAALKQWLDGTKRQRQSGSDDFTESFECTWQRKFGKPEDMGEEHYSVFCSMGEWNTIITDHLTDTRWDDLDFDNESDRDTLFRQYSKLFLACSEILTDYQDILTTLYEGKRLSSHDLSNKKGNSRKTLEKYNSRQDIKKVFNYLNQVCKHKCNNLHMCNHHLKIHFQDSDKKNASSKTITIHTLSEYMGENAKKSADTVEVPSLNFIVKLLLNGYKILDEEFRTDKKRFDTFCKLYEGKSCRA